MQFVKSNRALRDHQANERRVYLFESSRISYVRFVGEVRYVNHHVEQRPDTNGQLRNAIVFELELMPTRVSAKTSTSVFPINERAYWKKPMEELFSQASDTSSTDETVRQRIARVHHRSEAVRIYVLRRADGVCEGCNQAAPFKTKAGRPYLEPHHVHRISDGGPDHPHHVIALCPTCHRRVHYGIEGAAYNQSLIRRLETMHTSLLFDLS
jgi:5-methylcytosine-specific restriction enzyme A